MNTLKKLFVVLVLLVLFVAMAQAQVGPNAITLATNRLTAATTNSTAGTAFFVGNQATVNVLLSAYSTNSPSAGGVGDTNGTTSTITLRFEGSQDGSTYFTWGTNWDVLFSPTGTNVHTAFKALDATAVQYFRPARLSSTTTNNVFFPSATYWYK